MSASRSGYPLGLLAIIALALALLPILLTARQAQAHARLLASDPPPGSVLLQAPAEIRLTFSEAIDPRFSRADLLTADGTPMPVAPLTTDPADTRTAIVRLEDAPSLAPGSYLLVWRVLSAVDGHVTTGTVAFSVGTGELPSGSSLTAAPGAADDLSWWRLVIRWLELSALMAVAGGFAFSALVARPAMNGAAEAEASEDAPLRQAWCRIWWPAVGILTATMVLSLIDRGLLATGATLRDPPPLDVYRRLLFDSTFGFTWLARLGLVAAMAFLMRVAGRQTASGWLGVGLAAAALLTSPVAGHPAAQPTPVRAVANAWLHLVASAVWLGGLCYLVVTLHAVTRASVGEAPATAARLIARFSRVALLAITVLLVSGVINGALHIAGPRAARDQTYGLVAMAKVVLVVPLLIAAGVNLLVNHPRLTLAIRTDDVAALSKHLHSVRTLATAELALGTLVIAAAAALTKLPPADAPLLTTVAAKTVTIDQRATAGDVDVWLLGRLTGSPDDRFTITLSQAGGQPPAGVQRLIVEAKVTPGGQDDGARVGDRFDAQPLPGSPGSYAFPAVRLGYQGLWELRVIVRRAGRLDEAVRFQVDTQEAGVPAPRAVADRWQMPRVPAAAWFFGVLAVFTVAVGVVGVRRLPGLEPIAAALLLTMTALIAAGFAVSAARQTVPETPGTALTNPVLPDDASIQRGAAVYAAYCLRCHGPAGTGVDSSDPAHAHGSAADLTDRRSRAKRDGDLYHAVTHGVPGSAMPAYEVALTEEERWDVINYVRSLQ